MFHHLKREEQQATLAEVRRVLKPGGSLHLIDFAGTSERTNVAERMGETGFARSFEVGQHKSIFGRIAHYAAQA